DEIVNNKSMCFGGRGGDDGAFNWSSFGGCSGMHPSGADPCIDAIKSSSVVPSSICCMKMEEQAPCLCQYAKIPSFKPLIAGGQRVAAVCGVTLPVC
ncbi:hypothetical protein Csa_005844, partial [Cucumis sativus]